MTRIQLVRRLRTPLAGALSALALCGAAHAQLVYWENPGPLAAGQRTALALVFADTEPAGRVAPPHVDGLTVLGPPSQQSSIAIINGRRTASMALSFPVRAERAGTIALPSFDVATAAGTETVPPLSLEVGAATVPSSARCAAAPATDAVEARLTPSNMTPYAGQVVDVDATVALTAGRTGQVVGTPSWDQPGVVAEPWGDGTPVSTQSGSGVGFHTRIVAPQPGRVEVAPVQQDVQIESGRARAAGFDGLDDAFGSLRKFGGADLLDSFFARAGMKDATVTSNEVQLDVQPLPQPAPAGFTGAVGQFELASTVAPQQPKTGEPITWTLTLTGTGNWPGGVELPARAVPTEFRTLQPKQHKEFAAGALFTGALSEDLVLVPNRPGDAQLEPVRFVYFDPAKRQYQTIEARPPVLHITGAPLAVPQQSAAAAAIAPAALVAGAPLTAPASPAHLAPLPRDPRRGMATGFAPIAAPQLAGLAGAPIALVLLYWITLAVQRARLTDPRRPQRQAFAQLAPAIERVRAATAVEERLAALLAWQQTVAVALGVDLAAPTAVQLPDRRWIDVWSGSERALYGREHALPAGWCARALTLCTRVRRPRFDPLRAFTVRNLVPRTAAAALLIGLAIGVAHAADPVDAYTNGDFAGARTQLLARAADAPTDWIARYNLGLAEAQLSDAARALGETVAAFVHQPRNDDVRWNAVAFAAQVPELDRATAALVAAHDLPTALSPAAWQALVVAAALAVAGGAALVLRRRYYPTRRRSWCGPALLGIGLAVGGAALVSLRAYGPLADARAALVTGRPALHSVPTDAESAQQQKPLPSGTLVVVEQDFLGWVKVGLRGGETGWLRHGDLVPLYAAPSAS